MSRVIVKNLPKKVTEGELRQLFSEKGTITDLQLKSTAQGKFRQFAFVGYRSEKEAEEAIQYFNKMCLGTSRLSVERCTPLGVSEKVKNYSEPKPAVETKSQKKKLKKKDDLLEKYSRDPQFREFMNKHRQVESVVNEDEDKDDVEDNTVDSSCEEESSPTEKLANFKISDEEYKKNLMNPSNNNNSATAATRKEEPKQHKYQLFYIKLKDLPCTCKKKDVKGFLKPLVPFTIRLPPKIKGIAYAGFKDERNRDKALLKNKELLNGKRIIVVKYDNEHTNDGKNGESKPSKWKKQEMLEQEETVAESGRIFARNLSYTVTANDIEQLFAKYGPLADVNFPIDYFTGKPKGFATITYVVPENAVQAFTELDGNVFQGRMLHLLPGKSKDEDSSLTQDDPSYKKKKQAENKKQADSSHNWNALFLGSNAVAGVLANSFGVSKEDILNPHGNDNAAVRLALGETQIVAETKKHLEEHGVVLDAFSTPNAERSDTTILVKNLPSKTEPEEIRKVFQDFGVIGRVILPPSGLAAIVEFLEPSEAKNAFKKLVYKRFKSVPLFLEWAPKNSLRAAELKEKGITQPEKVEVEEEEKVEEPEEEPEEETVLFVKNLNFETTDESLKKHFESCGKLKYAKVSRKIDKNDPTRQLSMGYGFVQYIHKRSADAALKKLQQSQLDGKSLELKRSDRVSKDAVKTSRKTTKRTKQTGTKILVRNVPFQAAKKDLQELFQAFGEIKALRMPKKQSTDSSQSNRGFAFVDFTTENDAKAAFDALCQSTHLLGRRLVLEWAATEENVEQIRKRTADHFKAETAVKSKKSTFSLE